MPADKGVRLDDRQRIANSRDQSIETNEYHSVDGAEGEFLWSSSPQNVDLLPQRPNLCLKHYPRPDQIDNHPTNEPAKISHCTRSSSDSRSTAKQDKVCDRDRAAFSLKPLMDFRLAVSRAQTAPCSMACRSRKERSSHPVRRALRSDGPRSGRRIAKSCRCSGPSWRHPAPFKFAPQGVAHCYPLRTKTVPATINQCGYCSSASKSAMVFLSDLGTQSEERRVG